MPPMFLQWLFTSRVKLYCSIARFITQPVAHRTGCMYWRHQVLQTISHSWKNWSDQTDQKPSYSVVTCSLNYPLNTQWLIYLFFIAIISSLTFPRWVPWDLLPWELCRWMQEVGTCHCSRTSRSQPKAMSCALNIGTWHIFEAKAAFS